MEAYEIMQRLAATNSRNEKEQIIFDAFMNKCYDFFIGARLAIDPLISFGVKKVAEILEDDGDLGTFKFQDFIDLTNKLRNRQLTGYAARDSIIAAADRCHVPTWNLFYRRVLLRDLKVGLDEKTINKVLKKLIPSHPEAEKYLIPVFKCQLAHDGEDKAHKNKIKGKKLIDSKLDGCRMLAVMDKEANLVSMFTRNGLPMETFPEIQKALDEVLAKIPGSIVFDGELISPKGFQHLMTLIKRKEPHPDTDIIEYAMFDVIPLNDFRKGYCMKSQRERREVLEVLQTQGFFRINSDYGIKKLHVVPQIEVDLDTEEGQKSFSEFNLQVLDNGFEGVMLKDPEAPYEGKRSSAWLKMKPVIEVSLIIVGVEQGKEDGKYRHTLGALVCEGTDFGVKIRSNVGGMTDDMRDQLWNERENIIGMVVEVIADKLTLEEGEDVYSLRFPRLKGFRGTVPGEKL